MKYSLLILLLLTGCGEIEPKIGEQYLLSFDYENPDPFKQTDIDTVEVVAIKGDYIKWQYKKGYCMSTKTRIFKQLIKPFQGDTITLTKVK